MKRSLKACGSKQGHEKYTYPSPRRLGQQHQSNKSWQKVSRHARKGIKHARKLKHARKSK